MNTTRTLTAMLALAASLCAGCTLDAGDAPEIDSPELETEASRTAPITVTGITYGRRGFSVDILMDANVLRDRSANYLIAQLDYMAPNGAGVSPFSATDIDDVTFTYAGRGFLSATLTVAAPEPRDIEDVHATVGAAPTPYP